MTDELYKKHRPAKLSEVVGQSKAIATLKDMAKRNAIPHAMLFHGPSGTGKTTLARILRDRLGVGSRDYSEQNSADFRGIDDIRKIARTVSLSPVSGKARLWVIDEAHGLTPQAQDAMLKLLEDPPAHAYFVLCTTDPTKIKRTVRTRCTDVVFEALPDAEIRKLVAAVCEAEDKAGLSDSVLGDLVDAAEGSARLALVLLHQVFGVDDEAEQAAIIRRASGKEAAFKIAQALHNGKTKWPAMAKVLKDVDLDKEDPEGIRYMVLSYATKVLLGCGPQTNRAETVIQAFRDNFYDSKKAGVVLACREVIG